MLLTAAPAVASEPKFTPEPHDGQTVETDHGRSKIVSRAKDSDVEVSYVQMFTSKRPLFTVTVTNRSEYAVDMDATNVSVAYAMQALHIYSADELKAIVTGHAKWEGRGVAALGIVTGTLSGLATTQSRGTTYVRSGNGYYAQEKPRPLPDPSLRQDEGATGLDTELDRVRSAKDVTLAHIDETSLQHATLDDDDPHTWKFVIDQP
ncbi:MAG: hypothetical protein JF615_01125, partial [Asticcacaulis sp.]|nr:hypothetical protein [Asticcacaulis sp.]